MKLPSPPVSRSGRALLLMLLNALALIAVGGPASSWATAANPADFGIWNLDLGNDGTVEVPGRVLVPAAAAQNPNQLYPLVIAYHGIGERESDNLKQLNEFGELADKAKAHDFFLYIPQLPLSHGNWAQSFVDNTLRSAAGLMGQYNIDPTRVYVTGMSLGGGAVRYIIGRYADIYAAAVPVCGVTGGNANEIINAINKPIWQFHDKDDGTVGVSATRKHVNAILQAAGRPTVTFPLNNLGEPIYSNWENKTYFADSEIPLRYTEFVGGQGHWIWGTVYSDERMYGQWMLMQSCQSSLELNESVHFDFGGTAFTGTDPGRKWNSTAGTDYRTLNAVRPFSLHADGGMRAECVDVIGSFGANASNGLASALYPDNVGRDGWTTVQGATETSGAGVLRVHGLRPGGTYRVEIFASNADNDGGNGRSTRYKIGGTVRDLEVYNNNSATAVFAEVVANARGAFDVSVFPTPAPSTSRYGQINALSVTLVAYPSGATNTAPSVDAGPDAQIILPADTLALGGSSSDDGLPTGAAVTTQWSQVSGPGTVTFVDAGDPETTVTFPAAGTYVLELTADDTELAGADQVTITVHPVGYAPSGQLLFDFGDPGTTTAGNWNNVTSPGSTGLVLANAVATDGTVTSIGLSMLGAFSGINPNGVQTGVLYPVTAVQDSFYLQNGAVGEIRLEGLDAGRTYTLSFFASRATASATRVTSYTVGSQSVTLDPTDNTETVAQLPQIAPQPDGTITFQVAQYNGSTYGYLGVLEVSLDPAAPNNSPAVEAGEAQSVALPAMGPVVVELEGQVSDELPLGQLTVGWTVEQAPAGANVYFTNAASVDTTVSLDAVGTYVLKLTADDGVNAPASDTVEITVQDPPPTGGNGVVLFSQNFGSSSTVSGYVNAASPGFGQFNDISSGNGTSWTIQAGALQLARTGATGTAGFTRHTDLRDTTGSLVKVEFDFQVSGFSQWSALMELTVGDFSTFVPYGNWVYGSQRTASLIVQNSSDVMPGTYHIRLRDGDEVLGPPQWSDPISTGQPARIAWFINTSGQTQAYQRPDGQGVSFLAHREMALWVNGQTQIEGEVPTAWFASNSLADFRAEFFLDGTYRFDNFTVVDLLAGGPAGPTPVPDEVDTLQGVPVDIDVLANDGSAGLEITAVGAPGHGTASVVGGLVRYLPQSGYSGPDSFTYTVSDGTGTGQATVSVNVMAAGGLPGSGLTGAAIGSGALGSSRVVNTDQWEINGSGSGLAGSADSFYSEAAGVPGDFLLMARVHSLLSSGSAPRAGIMVRESDLPGSRMVALATTPVAAGAAYKLIKRTTADNAAAEISAAGSAYAYPDAWVMLERVGDIITASVSGDGASFVQVDSSTLAGLGGTVNGGIFASSGTAGVNARAVITGFDILTPTTVFRQNFDGPGLAGCISPAAPNANQFDDITSADGTSWSVSGNALQLARTSGTGAAGFTRHTDLPGGSSFILVEFDLQISGFSDWSPLMEITFGTLSSVIAYDSNGWHPHSQRAASLIAQNSGSGTYHIRLRDGDQTLGAPLWSDPIPTTQPAHIAWYINVSGSPKDYYGPAGEGPYTLAHRQMALWVDGQRHIETEVPTPWFTATALTDFRATFHHNATYRFDNFTITNLED